MPVLNFTPHTITVVNQDNEIIREYPSVGVARVSTTSQQVGEVDGISISKTAFGEVVGLPEPAEDTVYIVSMVVAQAAHRSDLVATS